jgi:hypothetical protein
MTAMVQEMATAYQRYLPIALKKFRRVAVISAMVNLTVKDSKSCVDSNQKKWSTSHHRL